MPLGGFSIGEWLLLLAVVFIAVGPRRLPEAGRALGQGLRAFRRGLNEARDAMGQPDAPPSPRPAKPSSLLD
ncbi:MAG TPA: twin-arginine translocase TatA/TatE family subunit [Gemmatimonadales bacterium]|jgi:sec-independent protein translocase protein TatA|nr:twin-arginine translocase TatA/TatE family subunit [Gemmatimonadales bacterium]